jgi:hypothetical protein
MKLLKLIFLTIITQIVYGQDDSIINTWTNGYEFYTARKYNDSLIVCSGGNLHEGGYRFTLKVMDDNKYIIIGNSPENMYEPSVGEKGDIVKVQTFDKHKVLVVYDSKENIQEALIELNSSLGKLVIKNRINYELAGKYIDKKGKKYIFYPNNLKASGLSNQTNYSFEYEYEFPIKVITFNENQSFFYEQIEDGLIFYKAQKDEYGDWEKSDRLMKLTKIEWINHTDKQDLKGKYPFASTEILIKGILFYFDNNELRIIRNEIFARHGYKFKTAEMRTYFESQDWYLGIYDNVNDKLTELEKLNIQLINKAENE